ncbi:MAG: hypothetical protein J6R91_05885 [Bacteroidaceae bacterium]|nr:hypothetical protein [Bacteroidaceae bacterium]
MHSISILILATIKRLLDRFEDFYKRFTICLAELDCIVKELYNVSIAIIVDAVVVLSCKNDADTLILAMVIKIRNLSIMISKANRKHLTIHRLKRSILTITSMLCSAKNLCNIS